MGRLEEAETEARAALGIRAAALGERSIMIGLSLTQVGDILRRRGDRSAARSAYDRGRVILLEHLPPEHPQVEDLQIRLRALDLAVPAGPSTSGHAGG
jgi:hypothetical protein